MVPPHIQGLNIVHPPSITNNDEPLDLLSPAHFRDIAAQLELWTNFSFQSDEPIIQSGPDDFSRDSPDDNNEPSPTDSAPAPKPTASTLDDISLPQSVDVAPNPPNFDINAVIPGFNLANLPPSAAPPSSLLLGSSIAQLLALQNAAFTSFPPPADSTFRENESHPHKRSRTRRTSVSTVDEFDQVPNTTPLTAAEDKRRRNTAASARFRLKKKEREAALEGKAKELELKVTELERECEALRRENGWLKGLVVGVTGVAQQPAIAKTTAIRNAVKKDE